MEFFPDNRLYTDFDFFQQHFHRSPKSIVSEMLLYHCYWKGETSQHQLLSLKSLLISQSSPYEVWMWMSAEDLARNNALIRELSHVPQMRFREYDVEREVQGTPYEKYSGMLKGGNRPTPVTRADCFRMLILAKYGGIYFDLDILFLKDLRPLGDVEFCYQWSVMPYGNNAVLRAFKDSPNMDLLLQRGTAIGSFHSKRLFPFDELKDRLKGFVVFPSFLFDPVWIANDLKLRQNGYCNLVSDFFDNETPMTLAEFFPHAYTYHWHNRWRVPIRQNTIVGQLHDEVSRKFAETF